MTEQYTPTTEEMRGSWVEAMAEVGRDDHGLPWEQGKAKALEAFDRWLAAHDAQVLRDAATAIPHMAGENLPARWLRDRADRIAERGGQR